MTAKIVRGTCQRCRRANLRLYPSVDYFVSDMKFLCSPCRRAESGLGTPEAYQLAIDKINNRMAEMQGWIAEIESALKGVVPDTRPIWERSK